MSARAMLLSAILLLGAGAWSAELAGVVRSAQGEPIPGAAVVVPALERGALTDSAGVFTLSDVPPGRYVAIARAVGFLPDTQTVNLPGGRVAFALAPDPLELPPLTVTGARPTEVERTTAFVATVHPDKIAAPATTVPELLDEAVGVRVRTMGGHGSFSTVSIRGSTAEQVRVYLDGVPLNQALGGGVNIALIPVSTIERIEVYRGVIPPEFGGSGIAGVVNFRTRAPSDSMRWNAGVTYGSWDTRTAHAWVNGHLGPVCGLFAFDYSHSDNDFLYLDDNGTSYNPDDDVWARRRNNQFFSLNLLARLASGPESGVRWMFSYSFLRTVKHLPGNSTFHELPSRAHLKTDQHLAELHLARALPLLSEGRMLLYHAFRRDRFDDREGRVGLGRKNTDDTTSVWGGKLSLSTLAAPAQRLAMDVSLHHEAFTPNDLLLADQWIRERFLQPSRRWQFAAYLSDELALHDRRIILSSQIGHERVYNRLVRDVPIAGPAVRDSSVTSAWPRALGISIRPRPWLRVQANWGRYLRVPNLYELFGDRGSTIGNPDLRPERGVNRDVGVELRGNLPRLGISRAEAELVYFDNRIGDVILFWEAYNRMKPFNTGGAHIRGVEASGNLATVGGFSCAANLTWQEPINTSTVNDSLYYGNDLPHRPRWEMDLRPELRIGPVTLFYGLHMHSRFYGQPLNRLADVIPAAWLHDAGVRVRLWRRFVLTFEGKNLSDVREFHSRYVPLPGRSWFITLQGSSH